MKRPKKKDSRLPPEMDVVLEVVDYINRKMVPDGAAELMYMLKYGFKPEVKNRVTLMAVNDSQSSLNTEFCAIEPTIPTQFEPGLVLDGVISFDFMWDAVRELGGRARYYLGNEECVVYNGVLFIRDRYKLRYRFNPERYGQSN